MSVSEDTRIVVSTVKEDGRVQFGQVIMEQQPAPKQIILVAVDPGNGLLYWKCSHSKLEPYTVSQHRGYSRSTSSFSIDEEPPFPGSAWEIPKEEIPNWDAIVLSNTRTKNRLVRELFA